MLVCNPPFGPRAGEEKNLRPLFSAFGAKVRKVCVGVAIMVAVHKRVITVGHAVI